MRDVEWATNNCTITFSTIGIWPENADGTDVNFCDRSHDKKLLATADDFGKVKVYNYPASQPRVSIVAGRISEGGAHVV
jgi:microtubule-associated protein-like 1/2